MDPSVLLDPVQILMGPEQSLRSGAVLIEEGRIRGFDRDARQLAQDHGITATALLDISSSPRAWWIRIRCWSRRRERGRKPCSR